MARSGSTRFRNKNVAEFGPVFERTTLLEWKINQLLEIFPRERVVFSSDSEDYLDIGSKFGLLLHKRDKQLADFGSFAENLSLVAKQTNTEFLMYANGPCNPLIGPKRIRNFLSSIDSDSLERGTFAVEEMKGYFAFKRKWLNFEPGENHKGSEFLENPFRVVWALTLRSRNKVISEGAMFSDFNSTYSVPTWASIDIDYEDDLVVANSFFTRYLDYEVSSNTN